MINSWAMDVYQHNSPCVMYNSLYLTKLHEEAALYRWIAESTEWRATQSESSGKQKRKQGFKLLQIGPWTLPLKTQYLYTCMYFLIANRDYFQAGVLAQQESPGCLQCWPHIWAQVCVLDVPLLIHLPDNGLANTAESDPSTWAPATHKGDWDEDPGCV